MRSRIVVPPKIEKEESGQEIREFQRIDAGVCPHQSQMNSNIHFGPPVFRAVWRVVRGINAAKHYPFEGLNTDRPPCKALTTRSGKPSIEAVVFARIERAIVGDSEPCRQSGSQTQSEAEDIYKIQASVWDIPQQSSAETNLFGFSRQRIDRDSRRRQWNRLARS
ncbi:MAG: hypothetical protein WCL44_06570 [bacterium]